ncbi:MAG: hypothetical protein OXJ90_12780 [Spirochaetaceae bacterium]|nr:hypothetical protein [Spirochaetaceae bacterium]
MSRLGGAKTVMTALLLGLLAAAPAAADVRTAVTVEALLAGLSDPDGGMLLGAGGSARLDLAATGNRNVRGQLSLRAELRQEAGDDDAAMSGGKVAGGKVAGVEVERAFLRARLPGFRLTAGKTRLAWGQGRFFNAGDILFGQSAAFAAGAGEFLTAAEWLVAAYVPLGRLSFLELVALPPLHPLGIERTDAGGRAVVRVGELTVEGGYLYAAARASDAERHEREHRAYLSLKGAVAGVDWHLSGGTALPGAAGVDLRRAAGQGLFLTGGGLAFLDLGPEAGVVTVLLEAGVRPWRAWNDATPAPEAALDHYGVYLFPELSYRPADVWNLSLSGVVSPVDGSGVAAAGASWNIHQGLTLGLYTAVMLGEREDTFALERPGGVSATLLARYVFGSS